MTKNWKFAASLVLNFVKNGSMEIEMETVTTVELVKPDDIPKVERCCFCINLKIGLNIWLVIESIIWFLLFVFALIYEVIYINKYDLIYFIDETDEFYFYLIFGDRFYFLDQKIRTYIILINFLLMMIFLTYLIFCIILLYGINAPRFRCFIPYFVIDGVFMFLAVIGCVIGMFQSFSHLFRISFIFLAIKLYIELCVISFFRENRGKIKKSDSEETATVVSEENQTTAV